MIYDVAQVGGSRVEVVILRFRLNVEVTRDAVHQKEARDHAAGVVWIPVLGVGFPRFRPLLILALKLELPLHEIHQR